MKRLLPIIFFLTSLNIFAQTTNGVELVYGHKDGLAMTMIMLKPIGKDNGKAIVHIVSGGWVSNYEGAIKCEEKMKLYRSNGYTVFNVMHGSQPRYNLQEVLSDIKRSVRFIRYNAVKLEIDPDKIGIIGESSGGHLALLVATTGNDALPNPSDPVDRTSDKVQAVAVLFPPTDFLNFGETGFAPFKNEAMLKELGVKALFDFKVWNDRNQEYEFPDVEEQLNIYRKLSPVYNVSSDDAPALLIHGDKDEFVPLQQSELMVAAYQNSKVPCSLIVKKDAGHGWKDHEADQEHIVKWFDQYLK